MIYAKHEESNCFFQYGTGIMEIGSELQEVGVVYDKHVFRIVSYIAAKTGRHIISGEYKFPAGSSMLSALKQMWRGSRIVRKVTVPEGLKAIEIRRLLEDDPYLSGSITESIYDCNVLPETYHYYRGDSRDSIIFRMQKELAKVLDLPKEKEILILASIVEKETSLDKERSIVAGVYANRLRIGMPLQADPTVAYGLNLDGPIKKSDLSTSNEYNTYLNKGLPPTPICCPGIKSIEAAKNPAEHGYFYFVADPQGGHKFATNLKEHNLNVSQYRRHATK